MRLPTFRIWTLRLARLRRDAVPRVTRSRAVASPRALVRRLLRARPVDRRRFPFFARLLQADAAQLEFDAEPPQDRRLFLVRLFVVLAGDQIRPLPLFQII